MVCCGAHGIDVALVLKKCNGIVSHLNMSDIAKQKLRQLQAREGAPETRPHHSVPTRWDSTVPLTLWFVTNKTVMRAYDMEFPELAHRVVEAAEGSYTKWALTNADFVLLHEMVRYESTCVCVGFGTCSFS